MRLIKNTSSSDQARSLTKNRKFRNSLNRLAWVGKIKAGWTISILKKYRHPQIINSYLGAGIIGAVIITTFTLLLPHSAWSQKSFQLADLNGSNGFSISGINTTDAVGSAIASGDINGDNFEDVIIGASTVGVAYVVFGNKNTDLTSSIQLSSLNSNTGFVIQGAQTGSLFGNSVDSGDINGDGIDDVIIGAPEADLNGNTNTGATYVIFGKSTGFSLSVNLSTLNGSNGFVASGAAGGAKSGSSLSTGDINGDNIDDLIIGAHFSNLNGFFSGSTYVVFGRSSFSATVDLSLLNGTNGFVANGSIGEFSGRAVSSGDINSDGFDDVIIGAPFSSNQSGATYIIFGKKAPFSSPLQLSLLNGNNGFVATGLSSNARSGRSVNAGDINGDGIDDIIIGATGYRNDKGGIFVIYGKKTGYSSSFDMFILDVSNNDGFVVFGDTRNDGIEDKAGSSIDTGDINNDGIDDLIAGVDRASINGTSTGATYVIFGKKSRFKTGWSVNELNGNNGFTVYGMADNDDSGRDVSSGDLNGDGAKELLISAPGAPATGVNKGEVYVFLNKNRQRVNGGEGFRLLAAPIHGQIFNNFVANFWTQGFTGANTPDGIPNVFTWDEGLNSNDQMGGTPNSGDWVPLSNLGTQNLQSAQGFLMYIFSDDNGPGVSGNAGFPKFIDAPIFGGYGLPNTGTVTPVSNLEDGRFYLAGNPYVETIDWDLLSKTGLSNTVYVWDHAASSWKSWNGSVGELTGGLIAPFQGFFVEGSGGNGSLTMEEADMAGSASLLKAAHRQAQSQSQNPVLNLELSAGGYQSTAYVQIDPSAQSGLDPLDGRALAPLTTSYTMIFTEDNEGHELNINALPGDRSYELPLHVQHVLDNQPQTGRAWLRWAGVEKFPEDWQLDLVNQTSGEVIDLRVADETKVELSAFQTRSKPTPNAVFTQEPEEIVVQSLAGDKTPYHLRITPGTLTDVEMVEPGRDLPEEFGLSQNFPNPFNPSTNIRFSLPQRAEVQLSVYDLMGRQITTLLNETRPAGRHSITFDTSRLSSGVYLYRLQAGEEVFTRKMILIK